MKAIVYSLLALFFTSELRASGQIRDLLIIGTDTFDLIQLPLLGSGLENAHRDLSCQNTDLRRGYWAHWKLENDSLFLIKVYRGSYLCAKTKASEHLGFEGRLFASWFTDSIKLPLGEEVDCNSCLFHLYKEHRHVHFRNGVVVSNEVKANTEQLSYHSNLDKTQKIEKYLVDSLGEYLDAKLDSAKWNEIYCDEFYILHFDIKGQFTSVAPKFPDDKDPDLTKCTSLLQNALIDYKLPALELPDNPFSFSLEIRHWFDNFEVNYDL